MEANAQEKICARALKDIMETGVTILVSSTAEKQLGKKFKNILVAIKTVGKKLLTVILLPFFKECNIH